MNHMPPVRAVPVVLNVTEDGRVIIPAQALAELGVDELVLVEAPPDNPDAASAWVAALADQWLSGDLSQR